jgi:ankyrin repeat protein/tetratricopeptide (TPR) repeat protein
MPTQELLTIKEQIVAIHQSAELNLDDANRDSILGPELMQFYVSGTGGSILRFAVSMDALRVIGIITGNDGVITPEEEAVTNIITAALAKVLGKLRPEYAKSQEQSTTELLEHYLQDDGPFGFLCLETTWAGGNACRRLADYDESISETYRDLMVGIAELAKSPDDLDSRNAVALELAKVVDLTNTTLAPSEDEYYMDFRPGTGRLDIQRGTDLMIRYSHTGWYGNASAGIEFHTLEEDEDGISKDGIKIEANLFNNITAFLKSSMAQAIECLVSNETVVCKEFDLREGLGPDSIPWSQALAEHGPIQNAQYATEDEWNTALRERRAISIIQLDDDQSIGIQGEYPNCWAKVIVSSTPSGSWIDGYDYEDVIDDQTDAHQEQGSNSSDLLGAVRNKDIAAVRSALESGAEVDIQDDNSGETPLILAIELDSIDLVTTILKFSPDLDTTVWNDNISVWLRAKKRNIPEILAAIESHGAEADTDAAVTHACETGNTEFLQRLLDEDSSPDGGDWGDPPLITAALHGHKEIIDMLLGKGANIQAMNSGQTTHIAAAAKGHAELAEHLAAKGAQVDDIGSLIFACNYGNLEVVETLIANGVDVNGSRKLNYDLISAMHQVITSYDFDDDDVRIQLANKLIAAGFNINQVDSDGKSFLEIAISGSRIPLVNLFIEAGADVQVTSKESGATMFTVACCENSVTTTRKLARCGVDVNQPDNDGNGPLHRYAIESYSYQLQTIKAAVACGTNLTQACNGKTVLEHIQTKLSEAEDEYTQESIQEVIDWVESPDSELLRGVIGTEPASAAEYIASAQLLGEVFEDDVAAAELLIQGHPQHETIADSLDTFVQNDEVVMQKIAARYIAGTGITEDSAAILTELYEQVWDDELKKIISNALVDTEYKLPIDSDSLTELDVATAKEIVAGVDEETWVVSFNNLGVLDAAAASELAQLECQISLYALETLDVKTAEQLAKHKAVLNIGVSSITEDSMGAIVKHPDVHLDSITDISTELAKCIKYNLDGGSLVLGGLTTVSDEVAAALSQANGTIVLSALEKLTNCPGHIALVKSYISRLDGADFSSVTKIDDEVLKLFAGFKGETIRLDGLSTISNECMEVLGSCSVGTLGLDGLTSLSLEQATSLQQYAGVLWLDGLTQLDSSVAAALSVDRQKLTLIGMTTIDADTLTAIVDFKGLLVLSALNAVNKETAAILATHKGGIDISGAEDLSDDAAHILALFPYELAFSPEYIPDTAAAILETRFALLTSELAEGFLQDQDGVDIKAFKTIEDGAAKILQEHLPDPLETSSGVERRRFGLIVGVLGTYHEASGDQEQALSLYEQSVRLNPDLGMGFWLELASLRTAQGNDDLQQAIDLYREACEYEDFAEACRLHESSIEKSEEFLWSFNILAWTLATNEDLTLRDGPKAVTLAQRLCEIDGWQYYNFIDTLAAAHAAVGDYAKAIEFTKQAIEVASPAEKDGLLETINKYQTAQSEGA